MASCSSSWQRKNLENLFGIFDIWSKISKIVANSISLISMGISGSQNGGTVPYKTIFCGDIHLHRPYIGLIYGRYLHFRILKFPLMICVEANLGISGRFASYSCPVSGPGRHSVSARGWRLQSPWCLTQAWNPREKRWEHLRYHSQTSSEKAARGWFDLANKMYFDD